MTNIALGCPCLLQNHDCTEPKEYEKLYIKRIFNICNECTKHYISLKILNESINRYQATAPWDKMYDPEWKKYLVDWMNAIFPLLEKALFSAKSNDKTYSCQHLKAYPPEEVTKWGFTLRNTTGVLAIIRTWQY